MKTQTSLLYLWLAVLSAPILAQTSPAASETQAAKPLNLSLPKEGMRSVASPLRVGADDDPVARNLRPESGRLPYGSGYEVRQRGVHAHTPSAGNYGDGGARSSAGSGKGSMGRGR
jgi:hypothetical protein